MDIFQEQLAGLIIFFFLTFYTLSTQYICNIEARVFLDTPTRLQRLNFVS